MKAIKGLTILLLTTMILTACGEPENDTMQSTAEKMVQALIDGDEKTVSELNLDEGDTTEYIMKQEAPKFKGLSVEDFTFEVDEELDEVKVLYENGEQKIRYWWIIEKVGEEYFITYF